MKGVRGGGLLPRRLVGAGVAFLGAVRLAKPSSLWSRRFYSPMKLERSP